MGLQKRIWRNEKADYARTTGFYYQRPPRSIEEAKSPRRPTPVSAGVKRHQDRIVAIRAGHTKRLALVPVQTEPSRQVRRANARRAAKMPL